MRFGDAFCRLKTYVGNAINTASAAPAWLAAKAVPVAADGAGLLRNAAADRVALFRRGCAPSVFLFNSFPTPAHVNIGVALCISVHKDTVTGEGAGPRLYHLTLLAYIVLYVVN